MLSSDSGVSSLILLPGVSSITEGSSRRIAGVWLKEEGREGVGGGPLDGVVCPRGVGGAEERRPLGEG